MSRTRDIARSFGAAATGYEQAAGLQRLVARRLAGRIAADLQPAPSKVLRILELGCGTGLLTRALRRLAPTAWITATDITPTMLQLCRDAMPADPRLQLVAMDAARPAVGGGYDLICSSLALQWLPDPGGALAQLSTLLAPGGSLHVATLVEGSLAEWHEAHRAEGLAHGGLDLPTTAQLALEAGGAWDTETVSVPHADGLAFLRGLRQVGAHRAAAGHRPLHPGGLRRVLHRFNADHGGTVSYRVAYGRATRPTRAGIFVTGTDTDVGKTLVSACLVRAWGADYWKPLQTGLDDDPGDSTTVQHLSGCVASRIHPPALELRASLSPEAALALEPVPFDPKALVLPPAGPGASPLVVEGAGGLMVPIGEGRMMLDLILQLGLPVLLVARSGLGTINHTLLSLAALRTRGVPIAGVILNGPVSPGNRRAIERHGAVRVVAEIPRLEVPGPDAIRSLASRMPALGELT